MARQICIPLPDPIDPLSFPMPGIGIVSIPRDFADDAANVCKQARGFIQSIQPVMVGLSPFLCILECLLAITKVFKPGGFVPIDPSAIPKIIQKCACLASFTPFGYCGTLRGVLAGLLSVLSCLTGLLSDIVVVQSRIAALLARGDAASLFAAECATGNQGRSLQNLVDSFQPVATLLESMGFLFEFVGVDSPSLENLAGSQVQDVLGVLLTIQEQLGAILDAVNSICPP